MATLTPEVVERLTRRIEYVLLLSHSVDGELHMFIDLGEKQQRDLLTLCVDWEGLPAKQVGEVVEKVLRDVREKVPEEIYPRTWFDAAVLDAGGKVLDFAEAKARLGGDERGVSLCDRAAPRPENKTSVLGYPLPEPGPAPSPEQQRGPTRGR